jgi:hypothetical protein
VTESSKTPYLHVRPIYRTGETPRSEIKGNRAGLLRLRDQIDEALESDRRVEARYREADEKAFVLWVSGAEARWMMGEPRVPERGLLERAAYPEERYRPGEEPRA